MATITLVAIRNFFGMKTKEFAEEWNRLSDKDKADIRTGFENGTMTY